MDNSKESTNLATNASYWNSGNNNCACEDTSDKIFLLSEKEATTSDYGFTEYNVYGAGNSRIRLNTDYAKANYAYQHTTAGWGCFWWLRSPAYWSERVHYISYNADPAFVIDYTEKNVGVVPALCVAPEALE